MTLPLAISTGDPGGVGPEIALAVALEARHVDPAVLFGDASWLARRARELAGADAYFLLERGSDLAPPAGKIGLADAGSWSAEALEHRATGAGGVAQLNALDAAIGAARGGRVRGLVTAPMSKSAVHHAGYDFVGHTEHLARACGLADDEVTMLFLGPRLRVGLVTTHVSIASAPSEITTPRVLRTVLHLGAALVRVATPHAGRPLRVAVAGLNPHAGEDRMFGDEEPRLIEPAMAAARERAPYLGGRVVLEGPLGAETAFRNAASGSLDAVVAMLHDQATIASKLLDWGDAVNTSWGLPFVRTSVDHGVAYDAAASGKIQVDGMRAAFRMAQQLTRAG